MHHNLPRAPLCVESLQYPLKFLRVPVPRDFAHLINEVCIREPLHRARFRQRLEELLFAIIHENAAGRL